MDPYAPKGWPRLGGGERRSQLDHYLARLTDLGATDDELDGVRATWDDPDAFPPDWKRELLHMSDRDLRAMLMDVREEHRLGTTTEDDDAATDVHRAYRQAAAEAQDRIGGNVASVLAWVGDDAVRAQVVHQLETGPDGANRRTLVGPLTELLTAATPTDAESPQEPSEAPASGTTHNDPRTPHSGAGSDHSGAVS